MNCRLHEFFFGVEILVSMAWHGSISTQQLVDCAHCNRFSKHIVLKHVKPQHISRQTIFDRLHPNFGSDPALLSQSHHLKFCRVHHPHWVKSLPQPLIHFLQLFAISLPEPWLTTDGRDDARIGHAIGLWHAIGVYAGYHMGHLGVINKEPHQNIEHVDLSQPTVAPKDRGVCDT